MSNRFISRLVLVALVLGGVSLATPATAATTTPPWEPDTNSLGTLSLYDATGAVVTGGTDLNHLFDYAVASTAAERSTTKATLYFGFPDKSKADSITWFSSNASTPAKYPDPAAPAPLNGFGARPVAHAASNEANLKAVLSTTTLDQNAGYKDIVQIRLRDSGPGNPAQDPFWTADVKFDQTANTWTQVFPEVVTTTPTTTTLTAAPTSPQAPGTAVTLTATVSPSAAGSVQFFDGTSSIGTASVSGGTASTTTSALAAGSHSIKATFTPTDTASFSGSTSAVSTYVITSPTPASDPSGLTIGAPASVRYNTAATETTTLTNARTKAALASRSVSLYRRASSKSAWSLVKTVTTSSKGAASVAVTLRANAQFQWRFAGTSTNDAVNSAVKSVAVTQTITAARTPATVKRGGTVKIYGTVAPAGTGQTVALQRLLSGKWTTQKGAVTIKKQKLPNGRTTTGFVFSLKLTRAGSYTYRVYKAATSTLAAGYSSSLALRAT